MTQTIENEAPDEAVSAPVTDDDANEEAEHEEAEHEAEQDASAFQAPPQPDMASEKDVRAIGKKLEAERKRHSAKLSDVLGDAATDALPCPLCFEGLMGFVLPGDAASLPEPQKAAALTFLGQEIPSELQPAEGVEECSRCRGFGQLAYPTKNPHMQTQTCPKCSGNGYTTQQQQASNVSNLPGVVTAADAMHNGVVPPCPLCGAVNSAGRPHFCNPVPQQ